MTWVLWRGGIILYKATWTSAARVEEFLERYGREPIRMTNAPFHTEQIELRQTDRAGFARGLERNGPRAVAEFARAEEHWKKRARSSARARRSG
jgi:hypothetical protein